MGGEAYAEIPPTAVGGSFSFGLQRRRSLLILKGAGKFPGHPGAVSRLELNNPPTAVGGIREKATVLLCRLELNNPPTAVGGIREKAAVLLCRLELNNPPTAVGGASLQVVVCKLLFKHSRRVQCL
jgi:hypothetical protein